MSGPSISLTLYGADRYQHEQRGALRGGVHPGVATRNTHVEGFIPGGIGACRKFHLRRVAFIAAKNKVSIVPVLDINPGHEVIVQSNSHAAGCTSRVFASTIHRSCAAEQKNANQAC